MSVKLQITGPVQGKVRIFKKARSNRRVRAEFWVASGDGASISSQQPIASARFYVYANAQQMESIEWQLADGDVIRLEARLRFDTNTGGPMVHGSEAAQPTTLFEVDADSLSIESRAQRDSPELHAQLCFRYHQEGSYRLAAREAQTARAMGYRFSRDFLEGLWYASDIEDEMQRDNDSFNAAEEAGYDNWQDFEDTLPD